MPQPPTMSYEDKLGQLFGVHADLVDTVMGPLLNDLDNNVPAHTVFVYGHKPDVYDATKRNINALIDNAAKKAASQNKNSVEAGLDPETFINKFQARFGQPKADTKPKHAVSPWGCGFMSNDMQPEAIWAILSSLNPELLKSALALGNVVTAPAAVATAADPTPVVEKAPVTAKPSVDRKVRVDVQVYVDDDLYVGDKLELKAYVGDKVILADKEDKAVVTDKKDKVVVEEKVLVNGKGQVDVTAPVAAATTIVNKGQVDVTAPVATGSTIDSKGQVDVTAPVDTAASIDSKGQVDVTAPVDNAASSTSTGQVEVTAPVDTATTIVDTPPIVVVVASTETASDTKATGDLPPADEDLPDTEATRNDYLNSLLNMKVVVVPISAVTGTANGTKTTSDKPSISETARTIKATRAFDTPPRIPQLSKPYQRQTKPSRAHAPKTPDMADTAPVADVIKPAPVIETTSNINNPFANNTVRVVTECAAFLPTNKKPNVVETKPLTVVVVEAPVAANGVEATPVTQVPLVVDPTPVVEVARVSESTAVVKAPAVTEAPAFAEASVVAESSAVAEAPAINATQDSVNHASATASTSSSTLQATKPKTTKLRPLFDDLIVKPAPAVQPAPQPEQTTPGPGQDEVAGEPAAVTLDQNGDGTWQTYLQKGLQLEAAKPGTYIPQAGIKEVTKEITKDATNEDIKDITKDVSTDDTKDVSIEHSAEPVIVDPQEQVMPGAYTPTVPTNDVNTEHSTMPAPLGTTDHQDAISGGETSAEPPYEASMPSDDSAPAESLSPEWAAWARTAVQTFIDTEQSIFALNFLLNHETIFDTSIGGLVFDHLGYAPNAADLIQARQNRWDIWELVSAADRADLHHLVEEEMGIMMRRWLEPNQGNRDIRPLRKQKKAATTPEDVAEEKEATAIDEPDHLFPKGGQEAQLGTPATGNGVAPPIADSSSVDHAEADAPQLPSTGAGSLQSPSPAPAAGSGDSAPTSFSPSGDGSGPEGDSQHVDVAVTGGSRPIGQRGAVSVVSPTPTTNLATGANASVATPDVEMSGDAAAHLTAQAPSSHLNASPVPIHGDTEMDESSAAALHLGDGSQLNNQGHDTAPPQSSAVFQGDAEMSEAAVTTQQGAAQSNGGFQFGTQPSIGGGFNFGGAQAPIGGSVNFGTQPSLSGGYNFGIQRALGGAIQFGTQAASGGGYQFGGQTPVGGGSHFGAPAPTFSSSAPAGTFDNEVSMLESTPATPTGATQSTTQLANANWAPGASQTSQPTLGLGAQQSNFQFNANAQPAAQFAPTTSTAPVQWSTTGNWPASQPLAAVNPTFNLGTQQNATQPDIYTQSVAPLAPATSTAPGQWPAAGTWSFSQPLAAGQPTFGFGPQQSASQFNAYAPAPIAPTPNQWSGAGDWSATGIPHSAPDSAATYQGVGGQGTQLSSDASVPATRTKQEMDASFTLVGITRPVKPVPGLRKSTVFTPATAQYGSFYGPKNTSSSPHAYVPPATYENNWSTNGGSQFTTGQTSSQTEPHVADSSSDQGDSSVLSLPGSSTPAQGGGTPWVEAPAATAQPQFAPVTAPLLIPQTPPPSHNGATGSQSKGSGGMVPGATASPFAGFAFRAGQSTHSESLAPTQNAAPAAHPRHVPSHLIDPSLREDIGDSAATIWSHSPLSGNAPVKEQSKKHERGVDNPYNMENAVGSDYNYTNGFTSSAPGASDSNWYQQSHLRPRTPDRRGDDDESAEYQYPYAPDQPISTPANDLPPLLGQTGFQSPSFGHPGEGDMSHGPGQTLESSDTGVEQAYGSQSYKGNPDDGLLSNREAMYGPESEDEEEVDLGNGQADVSRVSSTLDVDVSRTTRADNGTSTSAGRRSPAPRHRHDEEYEIPYDPSHEYDCISGLGDEDDYQAQYEEEEGNSEAGTGEEHSSSLDESAGDSILPQTPTDDSDVVDDSEGNAAGGSSGEGSALERKRSFDAEDVDPVIVKKAKQGDLSTA